MSTRTSERVATTYGSWNRVRPAHLIIVLTIAFGALLTICAALTPGFRAPDEIAHLSSVLRLAESGEWPDPGEARIPDALIAAQAEADDESRSRSTLAELEAAFPGDSDHVDQMTQHPPVYYGIAAGAMNLVDWQHLRWDHVLFMARMVSAVLALPLVWLLWSATRRATRSPRAGIVAAAIPLAIPQLAQTSASVSNDAFVVLTGALVGWLTVRVATSDRRWFVLLALGVALGAAGLSKGTMLAAVPMVFLALLFGRGRPEAWGRRIWQAVWPLLVSIGAGMIWWGLNVLRYGSVQPDGLGRDPRPWASGTGPNPGTYLNEVWKNFIRTFWGGLGQLEVFLAEPLTDIITAVALVVLLAFGFRSARARSLTLILLSQPIATAAILLAGTWSAYTATQMFPGMQGRYFFGGLVSLVVASALAWSAMVTEQQARRRVGFGLVIGAIAMSVNGLAASFMGLWEGSGEITLTGLRLWLIVGIADRGVIIAAGSVLAVALAGSAILSGGYLLRSNRIASFAGVPGPPAPAS